MVTSFVSGFGRTFSNTSSRGIRHPSESCTFKPEWLRRERNTERRASRSPSRFQFQFLRNGRCRLPRNGKRNRLYHRFAIRRHVVLQGEESDCRNNGKKEENGKPLGSFPGRLRNRYARPTVSFHKLPGFTNRSGSGGRSGRRGARSGGTGQ